MYYEETDDFATTAFNDKTIRREFVCKVYTILSVQLLFTLGLVNICFFVEAITHWIQENLWCYVLAIVVFLITYFALSCCSTVRRQFPGNFICLAVFTLAFTYMTATITSFYEINSIVVCLTVTVAVTVSVSIIAACCPCDVTKCWAAIAVLSVFFMVFGLICILIHIFVDYNSTLQAIYGGIAGLLFTIYLAFDTQMILGGRKHEMDPEEYIFGALQLYLDIVQLFLIFLSLFGAKE